jgi:hypothetical protein
MALDCSSRNQGAYNYRLPKNGAQFTDGNAAQTRSGSVSEVGLGPSQNDIRYDLKNNDGSSNGNIEKIGWGK